MRTHGESGSADDDADEGLGAGAGLDDDLGDPDGAPWEHLSPPDNEVPSPVPVSLLLARTDDLAVALVGMSAYSSGVTFRLAVRLRTRPTHLHRHDVSDLMGGWRARRAEPGQQLLLGVQYPDGRRASNVGVGASPDAFSTLPQPMLETCGGSGSDLRWDQSFWLTPVPGDGPVTFVCRWDAMGVPESRHVVDGGELAAASARAVVLWPPAPDEPEDELYEPDLPATGWFAGPEGEA